MQENDNWEIKMVQEVSVYKEIRRLCPEIMVNGFQDDLQKMGKIFYELQIRQGSQNWTVLKTKEQIEAFTKTYDQNFNRLINFKEFFKKGLEILSSHQGIQKHQFFREFFEIEYLEYRKCKSLPMLKKCGGRYIEKCFCQLSWLSWKERDFIITCDGVLYCHRKNKNLKEFISFGKSFRIKRAPDIPQVYGILLISNHRKLLIKGKNMRDYFTFLFYLDKAKSVTYNNIRYDSFAPVRSRNSVNFYIDGKDYFHDLAKAIETAQHEIFICGWWLSPEFHLIRPCTAENQKYRVDNLLNSMAEKNVKIYILLYWQSIFLTNCSEYTKQKLEKLHRNIRVIRHPDVVLPNFWSHHEKMVIIDQHLCFTGGLDICYGRYDNSDHQLHENKQDIFPGIEYNNARISDFNNVRKYKVSDIPRYKPRLPWHDIAISIRGESVKDFCHHFIQYWNMATYQAHKLDREVLVKRGSKLNLGEQRNPGFIRTQLNRINDYFRDKFNLSSEQNIEKKTIQEIETSKPMASRKKKISALDQEYQFELGKQNIQEQEIKTLSLSKKFQIPEREIRKESNLQGHAKKTPESEQGILDDLDSQNFPDLLYSLSGEKISSNSYISEIYEASSFADFDQFNEGEVCQALRSASHWSIGCKQNQFQKSIFSAYIDLILSAKNYIYIQNQFFISGVPEEDVVKNRISDALVERIATAVRKDEKFKVYVFLPLIPGFAGQLYDSSAGIPRAIMNWQYRTISRHKKSLYARIRQFSPNPEQYIRFFGLRTHGILNGKPTTEMIYIHSKLMIVDDCRLILGSANINDRSMEGDRDSELCVLVEKGQQAEGVIRGQEVVVSKKISEMRIKLFMEHFGLDQQSCKDPVNQDFFNEVVHNSHKNTLLYREVFSCYPDDTITKMKDLFNFTKKDIEFSKYVNLCRNVKGNAVDFPLNFLRDEDLTGPHPDVIST